MIIHCTQKLAAKLPEISATPLQETNPVGSWHAHLYTYDRRQCVLFCHDKSRYCLFLPGLLKRDLQNLADFTGNYSWQACRFRMFRKRWLLALL